MKRKKTTRKRTTQSSGLKETATIFLPDHLTQVKAIAWRGLSDDQIAYNFGVNADLFQAWKKQYPSFREAIEKGRTHADAKVVESLYHVAVGDYDVQVASRSGITTLRKHKPDVGAINTWLTNRDKENWSVRHSFDGGGKKNNTVEPLIPVESREQLIASIVAMIESKPDGETNPEKKK